MGPGPASTIGPGSAGILPAPVLLVRRGQREKAEVLAFLRLERSPRERVKWPIFRLCGNPRFKVGTLGRALLYPVPAVNHFPAC
jgi:hypothetical protein